MITIEQFDAMVLWGALVVGIFCILLVGAVFAQVGLYLWDRRGPASTRPMATPDQPDRADRPPPSIKRSIKYPIKEDMTMMKVTREPIAIGYAGQLRAGVIPAGTPVESAENQPGGNDQGYWVQAWEGITMEHENWCETYGFWVDDSQVIEQN